MALKKQTREGYKKRCIVQKPSEIDNMTLKEAFETQKDEIIDAIIVSKFKQIKAGGTYQNQWREEELVLRNMAIYNLLRKGLSQQRVKEELMKRWGVAYKTADEYIKIAVEALANDDAYKEDLEKMRSVMVEQLSDIVEKARERGDMALSLKAYQELNKINGLAVQKVEEKVENNTTITFDFS